MMDEKTGTTWFLIYDNIEIFRISCAHWEFPWIVEGCIVDRNGYEWIKNFESGEEFMVLYGKIY